MLVRIEGIEEFELAGRVSRQAITDEVLRGIRNLDERKHIEPFLRDILADWNETPHTSTESSASSTQRMNSAPSCNSGH